MKRLYLIRHNIYTFKGPMTLDEVRKYSKSMQSTSDDEISGSCGQWIQLGDYGRLKKYYPEVSKVVAKDGGDWGVSLASVEPIPLNSVRSVLSRRNIVIGVGILALAVIGMMLMSGGGSISGVLASKRVSPRVAHEYLESDNMIGLSTFMKNSTATIVKSLNSNPKALTAWIPYMRAYAFYNDGTMDKIPQKVLIGNYTVPGVNDCRADAWVQVWRAQFGGLESYVQGTASVGGEIERLLAWDPHWIAKRHPQGWLKPNNLYEGCFNQAVKVMQKIISNSQPIYTALLSRISFQKDVMSGKVSNFSYDNVTQLNLLDLFTCYEESQADAHIATCDSFQIDNARIAEILKFKRAIAKARVAVNDPVALKAALAEISGTAPLYQFDYQPELMYWQLRSNQVSAADAAKSVQEKYPDVLFD